MELDRAAGVAPKRGMILPFQPLSISFNEVEYFVDMPAVRFLPSYRLFSFSVRVMMFVIDLTS